MPGSHPICSSDILYDFHDGFRTQSVPNGVLPRPLLSFFRDWTGTLDRVSPIGFDLPKRSHKSAPPSGRGSDCRSRAMPFRRPCCHNR
jgi:hypothetical protein